MKNQATWGIVGALAVAGVLGGSLQLSGRGAGEGGTAAVRIGAKQAQAKAPETDAARACDELAKVLELFLTIDKAPRPSSCLPTETAKTPARPPLDPKFVIATLPDPVHTHLALMFDRMAEVIQQAAQDEGYSYEASWLPWDDKDDKHVRLADEDQADDRKELVEEQPGILVFRKNSPKDTSEANDPLAPYRDGLIVFVVGEDPTRGIHTEQFTNALEWIKKLKGLNSKHRARTAILGPTFSGSFPSLAKLLSEGDSPAAAPRAIYSGTANDGRSILQFDQASKSDSKLSKLKIDFHGFLERDEVSLERYCRYVSKQGNGPGAIAVISEDETAYGGTGIERGATGNPCLNTALWLYYPRDISALRAAYQANSIFNNGAPQQSSDVVHQRLPSDLADPAGEDHDTIRSYAGNQTPLSQEAYLLGIVNAMRVRHIQYVILRSTNALDQLFLTRYLRRAYPDARIVTDSSDRLFERDPGATGMGGTMSLSTYPLFEREREWVDGNGSSPGQRLFDSDYSEGTYIAFRLLLHTQALSEDPSHVCALRSNAGQIDEPADAVAGTLPPLPVSCRQLSPPIPDYGMPSWVIPKKCQNGNDENECDAYRRPATWLTALGRDGFWPIAALNEKTMESKLPDRGPIGENGPQIPLSLKLFLALLGGFVGFHLWCCWKASFTAKPSFRAHFVDPGEKRHTMLVFLGGLFVAMLPLLVGWGCGAFDPSSAGLSYPCLALLILGTECLVALLASFANIRRVEQLASASGVNSLWVFAGSVLGIILFAFFVLALKRDLTLANRFFTYYRNMHILSGVSAMVPLLTLTLGMYAWFWHSLHGLALFGADRCRLPSETALEVPDTEMKYVLRMFSQEQAAIETERGAKPLDLDVLKWAGILAASAVAIILMVSRGHLPIRTLGAKGYAIIFSAYLTVAFTLMFAEAWQLLTTWTRLRDLLTLLDRTALRRTLAALRGFSWGSVWGMSGNVLDVRYKLLSRQLESLGHTVAALRAHADSRESDNARACVAARYCIAALKGLKQDNQLNEQDRLALTEGCLESLKQLRKSSTGSLRLALDTARDCIIAQKLGPIMADTTTRAVLQECISALEKFVSWECKQTGAVEKECVDELEKTRGHGKDFAGWYAHNYDNPGAKCPTLLEVFQESAAETAGILLVRLLLPEWSREKNSLILVEGTKGDCGDDQNTAPPLSKEQHIRDAEEFVCLPYMGFVQNILGRMRSMVMSILWLFVATAIAISSYPFDPRQVLSGVILVFFILLGAVIFSVYAQMHRDPTLSHVTNSKGLGIEFWFKILGVGIAPLLGLLTTVFPEIADFVFSWLQPGLQSIK